MNGLWLARMLKVEGYHGGILINSSFAFIHRILQAQDVSLQSREFFWMHSRSQGSAPSNSLCGSSFLWHFLYHSGS